jgi:hypothetical protein
MFWDEVAKLWDQVPVLQSLSDKSERFWLLYVAVDALHGLGEARAAHTVDAFLREYFALVREWGARYPHVYIQPLHPLERSAFDHVPAIELVCYLKKNDHDLKERFIATRHRNLRDVLADELNLKDVERRCSMTSGGCESRLRLHRGIE